MEKEKLKQKYNQLQQAVSTLQEAINLYNNQKNSDQKIARIIRDGLIQRFEYCYDLLWKYLKEYLFAVHGIQQTSPRTVFYECSKQSITNVEETGQLLNMIDDRNATTHTYSEDDADRIGNHIINYMDLIHKIITKSAPSNAMEK